ncbi:MAG TPA: DVUA0089 family protein, partial [Bryobacteraceae bacterium]|nr:DVUA0089 family protein [Bryobacteraceae bacterium]
MRLFQLTPSRLRSIVLIGAASVSAVAADFSFRGTFQNDDERAQFTFTLTREARVAIRSLSYGGGTNAEGTSVAAGGFDATVSVFDKNGLLVATNRDGGCGVVGQDAASLACWDAYLNPTLPSGSYQVVLTQADNMPKGPFMSDGFVFDGTGNFTTGGTGTGFTDLFANKRTNVYAVDIAGADTAKPGLSQDFGSLVNGASNGVGPIAPNTIVTFYGVGLAGTQPDVTIAGKAGTVLYAGDTQINIVVPGDVPVGNGQPFRIQRGATTLAFANVDIVASAPALFTSNQSGSGQAAVLNQNYGVNAPATPAQRGSYIMIYGTGFGVANAPGGDGLSTLKAGVSATVGGIPAEVTFAGLAYGFTPGLQQINIKVPENAPTGAAVAVKLESNGAST